MNKLYIAALFTVPVFIFALIMGQIAAAVSYDYSAPVTITNNTGASYNGRVIVNTFPKALYDGGFIYQADGDDIAYSAGQVCALGLSDSGTQPWLLYPGAIAAGAHNTTLYYGNHTATRNQTWIAAGSDTVTVDDHADLDLEKDFSLEATITLFTAPGTGYYKIIDKVPDSGTKTGYQLIVTGTPQVVFHIYGSGTEAVVALDVSLNTEYDIEAWYNGHDAVITDGADMAIMAMSGSVTTNGEDLEVCEFAGLCDNPTIKES